jgi:thiol-disulfide isomerase/thioredoxin
MLEWTPEKLEGDLHSGKNIFLKLWKPGCGACKLSQPAVRRVEEGFSDKLLFGEINAEEFPEMLEIADTEVLPVFFIFKDKKLVGKHIGFKGQAKLHEFVESAI